MAARRAKLHEVAWKDPMFVPRSHRGCPRPRRGTTTPPRRCDDEDEENGDDGNVDGCPEALLPGALTRRLSACRPCLTFPPSRPPVPPSNPRLTLVVGLLCVRSLALRSSPTIPLTFLTFSPRYLPPHLRPPPSLSPTNVPLRTLEQRDRGSVVVLSRQLSGSDDPFTASTLPTRLRKTRF